ncbi:MAG TPA: histidine phosphatase family protein [Rhodobacteraceae bacterium]|nr:histidine phosphatase family protein [Paracoccaceae bacterium]
MACASGTPVSRASGATVWWVRHGPTHRKEMVGWSDVPADLSDTQALARLDAFLPQAPVVSSDLARARATADAIQGARPRLAHVQALREINFGAWELRSAEALYEEDPDTITAYWDDPSDIRPPGGESFTDLAARVNGAVDTLVGSGDLIVVAHFGVILTQLHRARGGSVKAVMAQRVENLSVTALRFDDGAWHEELSNHRP